MHTPQHLMTRESYFKDFSNIGPQVQMSIIGHERIQYGKNVKLCINPHSANLSCAQTAEAH